jgi:Uma2 family endonuclease
MGATAARLPTPAAAPDPASIDQRVLFSGVGWGDYQRLLDLRGERAVPRLVYLDGELELMSPSVEHEGLKTRLGRLIEFYAGLGGIALEGFGSWTLRGEQQQRGAEADECYLIGPLTGTPTLPDFVVEVVWTRGGLDKLEIYRGLGVPEVWIWQDGRLRFYTLADDGYRACARSRFLPALDPRLIQDCMAAPSQTEALGLLRTRLGPERTAV